MRDGQGRDVCEFVLMAPEIVLDQLSHDPQVLLDLLRHRATSPEADLEFEDFHYMLNVARTGHFSMPDMHRPKYTYARTGGYATEMGQVNWDRISQEECVRMRRNMSLSPDGPFGPLAPLFVDHKFYDLVLNRKFSVDFTLSSLADEFLVWELDIANQPVVGVSLWTKNPRDIANAARVIAGETSAKWVNEAFERDIMKLRERVAARSRSSTRHSRLNQDNASAEPEDAPPVERGPDAGYWTSTPEERRRDGWVSSDCTLEELQKEMEAPLLEETLVRARALKDEAAAAFEAGNGERDVQAATRALACYQEAVDLLEAAIPGERLGYVENAFKVLAALKAGAASMHLVHAQEAVVRSARAGEAAKLAFDACEDILAHPAYLANPAMLKQSLKRKLSDRRERAKAIMDRVEEYQQQRQALPQHPQASGPQRQQRQTQQQLRRQRQANRRQQRTQRQPQARRQQMQEESVDTEQPAGFSSPLDDVQLASFGDLEPVFGKDIANECCPVCLRIFHGPSDHKRLAAVLPCNGSQGRKHAMCVQCLGEMWYSTFQEQEYIYSHDCATTYRIQFQCVICRRLIAPAVADTVSDTLIKRLPAEDRDNLEELAIRLLGPDDGPRVLAAQAFCVGGEACELYELLLKLTDRSCSTVAQLSSEDKQHVYQEERTLQFELIDRRREVWELLVKEGLGVEERRTLLAELERINEELPGVSRQAASRVFERLNAGDAGEALTVNGIRALDFHALQVKDVNIMIWELVSPVLPVLKQLVIITGQGRHNLDGQTPLRDEVKKVLDDCGFSWRMVEGNDGAILVSLE